MRPLSLLLSFGLLIGCAEAPVVPGGVDARWTLSPNNCETLHLATVRARLKLGDEVIAEATGPCQDDGSHALAEILPGTYTLVIEGLNSDETPRATYIATQEGVKVLEEQVTESEELRLVEKFGRIHVRWAFDSPLQCVDVGAAEIHVQVIDGSNQEVGDARVPCANTFTDSEDGQTKSGLLISDLKSAADLVVLVDAYDADQSKILTGMVDGFVLLPGETEALTVKLCAEPPCE